MSDAAFRSFDDYVATGAHRRDQDGAPKPYMPDAEPRFRAGVIEFLQSAPPLYVTTLDKDGWPLASSFKYLTLAGPDARPIVYLFADKSAPEIDNVTHEPRVSFATFMALSFERRRETKSVQAEGLARIVVDAKEIADVTARACARGETYAALVGPDLVIVRIDVSFLVHSNMSAKPQWGAIDYAPAAREQEDRISAARGRIEAEIAELERLNGEVVAIKLKPKPGWSLPAFVAGSHIQIYVGDGLVRPYSLCSASNPDWYRIGVLREPNSRGGSQLICTQWKVGDSVRISTPRNFFPIDRTARKAILIGGGVGVTPLIAMAEHFAATGADFELHYCYRNDERAAFLDELLSASFNARVKLHPSSRARFDVARDLCAPDPRTHLYVCGPSGFMDKVTADAVAAGWSERQIHSELFGGEADTSGEPFIVNLDDGKSFTIPVGKSIAQVLLGEGYQIEMACEKGICGSCIAEVKEGVPDHRDHFLTEFEKIENDRIALCCSRARTPALSIVLSDQ